MIRVSSNAIRGIHPYLIPQFWIDNLEYFQKIYPLNKKRYLNLAIEAQKEIEHKMKEGFISNKYLKN